MAEFCKYCGAGVGAFRREGEGTCPRCDSTDSKEYAPAPQPAATAPLRSALEQIGELRRKRNSAVAMGDWEGIGYVRACDDILKLLAAQLATARPEATKEWDGGWSQRTPEERAAIEELWRVEEENPPLIGNRARAKPPASAPATSAESLNEKVRQGIANARVRELFTGNSLSDGELVREIVATLRQPGTPASESK